MLNNEQRSPSLIQPTPETATAVAQQSLISDEKLKQLYAAMVKLRLSHEQSHSKTAKARSRSRFQEASEAACIIDLRPQDTIASGTDESLSALMGSLPLNSTNGLDRQQPIMAAPSKPASPHVLQIDDPSDRLMLATGVAFAYRAQTQGNVVIAFSNADKLSAARDSLCVALAHRLPIIYVQRANNSSRNPAWLPSKASQLLAIPVDQTDVIAVYRVAYEAIDKARRGVGPTMIECVRYSSAHGKLGSNNSRADDPLEHMEQYLRKKSLWSDDFRRSLEENFRQELRSSRGKRKQVSRTRES
jgi:TPP-dependent pyruvate/acetoin dehydrogenase alpha subunit